MPLANIESKSPLSFLRDLYRSAHEHDVFTGAAALAYYFFLAIFPALIFLLSLIPFLPFATDLYNYLMTLIRETLPAEGADVLAKTVAEVTIQKRGGLLSLGGIMTLWAASAGMYALMRQLNSASGIQDSRPFWKVRGVSVLLTLILSVLILLAFVLMIFGGVMTAWLDELLHFGRPLLAVFSVFQWIVSILALLTGFALIFHFGPDTRNRLRFLSPGAVTGALVALFASSLFRLYVQSFADYAVTYGSIGAVIVLMLWLYIMALVTLIGYEINLVAERRWGKGREAASAAMGQPSPLSPGNA